jgi:hypothetical protein
VVAAAPVALAAPADPMDFVITPSIVYHSIYQPPSLFSVAGDLD